MKVRGAAVAAYAKLNLTLKVLHKRPDDYHELRTVFQTISLHDTLQVEYRPARRRSIAVESSIEIPNNIVVRAASMMLDELRVTAEVVMRLRKRIPMGGGLGGGSTNAAAVLLALPSLAGKRVEAGRLTQIAAALGSDVPFFLLGGTALGLGRGEELYPFPEPARSYGVVVTPGIHVSTAEAYRALGRASGGGVVDETFPALSWKIRNGAPVTEWGLFCQNDFESAVFGRHPELGSIRRKLTRQGASVAMMSGSGSSVFGFFESRARAVEARKVWAAGKAQVFHTIGRAQYRAAWSRSLSA